MSIVDCLVVGYGNSLRSDDGIGIQTAEIVASWNLPQVRSLALHQLTPELTLELAQADLAIFVDSYHRASDIDSLKIQRLQPSVLTKFSTHLGDPRILLSLTQALYSKCPRAWWILVPGVNFQLGDRLSPLARQGVKRALKQIESLLTANLSARDRCTKSA